MKWCLINTGKKLPQFINTVLCNPLILQEKCVLGMSSGGKDGRCLRLKNLSPSGADCLEILGASSSSKPLASPGLSRPVQFYTDTGSYKTIHKFVQYFKVTVLNSLQRLHKYVFHTKPSFNLLSYSGTVFTESDFCPWHHQMAGKVKDSCRSHLLLCSSVAGRRQLCSPC